MKLAAAFCLLASYAHAATLPPTPGTFGVSITTHQLDDPSRVDPYAPNSQTRSLMLSVFAPVPPQACNVTATPYMPPPVASAYDALFSSFIPTGTFGNISLTTCDPLPNTCSGRINSCSKTRPTLIFSPGAGNSRLEYQTIALTLSARGWTVVSVDHSYDAVATAFLDGHTVFAANITTPEVIAASVDVRVADISFLINQLQTNSSLLSCSRKPSFALFGHSLDGATAASVMNVDERVTTGINFDGQFFGPVATTGVDRPYLLVGNQARNLASDANWATFYAAGKNAEVLVNVQGAVHGTFTDLPYLASALGLAGSEEAKAMLAPVLGSIPGEDVNGMIADIVEAWISEVNDGKVNKGVVKKLAAVVHVVVSNSTIH